MNFIDEIVASIAGLENCATINKDGINYGVLGRLRGHDVRPVGWFMRRRIKKAVRKFGLSDAELESVVFCLQSTLEVHGSTFEHKGKKIVALRPTARVATIVHELVHVRQMLDRRLVVKEDHVLWEGEVYPSPTNDYSTKEKLKEYLNTPWEREAVRAEYDVSLTRHFVSFEKTLDYMIEHHA